MALLQFDYRLGSAARSRQDPQIESLIDAAGRDRVLARAKSLGWGDDVPPKWVWVEIAQMIMRENTAATG